MITIKRGEFYVKHLQLAYADTKEPLDLTGCSAYCQIRDVPGGTLLATGTCTISEETGEIWARFSGSQTEGLPLGECGYDIWLQETSVARYPLYTTRCQVVDAYTKDFGE